MRLFDFYLAKKPSYLAVLALCVALAPSHSARAGSCAPTSATISYEGDDFVFLYLNGNLITNGALHTPGNPAASQSIPVTAFAAAGSPNYFAAKVVNTQASLVGAGWLITINCAGGGTTYRSNTDSAYTMYDDWFGTNPLPNDGSGNAWYQAGWSNPSPSTYPFQAPVLAPASALSWIPSPIIDPTTGLPLSVLSHSSNAQQCTVTGSC